mgnify:CR=1 FL=1
MIKPHSHIEIAYSSIRVFNDGLMDAGELNFLLGLALRDLGIDVATTADGARWWIYRECAAPRRWKA